MGGTQIESTATVLPPAVLDAGTRARLKDVVGRDDPVVDARRCTRIVFLVMTLAVWFPTMWSGSKPADVAVQQWAVGIGLTVAAHLVLGTVNRYAVENARAALRRDAIARAIAAAEAHAQAQAQLAKAREEAAARHDGPREGRQQAAAALANLMERSARE